MDNMLTAQDAEKAPWFHSIDLGDGFISKSRFTENVPPNYTLFGFFDVIKHLDLKNARCLDIGTMDGISSFVMKGLGASEVVATDIGSRNTFAFARERLGLDVQYVTDTDLYNISDKITGKFDVVLMAGILYHVFDPLYAITVARYLTKNNAFAILETHFLKDEKRPIMVFNPGDEEPIDQANFFWRASPSCLEAMFAMCSFKVIARRDVGKRVTYLLQAVRPSKMTGLNAITKKIHKDFMRYKHYRENINFNALEQDTTDASTRLITKPQPYVSINVKSFKPEVPYQPKWDMAQ